MYKRTKFVIANTPPNLQKSGQRCIAECQFGKAVRRAYERGTHNPIGGGKYLVLICVKRTK